MYEKDEGAFPRITPKEHGKIVEEHEDLDETDAGASTPQQNGRMQDETRKPGVWHEVGRTELVESNNHPLFEKKIEIPIYPESLQHLKFRVLDVGDPDDIEGSLTIFLGVTDATLDTLLRLQDVTRDLEEDPIRQHLEDKFGQIFLSAVEKPGQAGILDDSDDEYELNEIKMGQRSDRREGGIVVKSISLLQVLFSGHK